MKIKIKGEFIVETESGMMNNVKQPLCYLELESFEPSPIRIIAFNSKKCVNDNTNENNSPTEPEGCMDVSNNEAKSSVLEPTPSGDANDLCANCGHLITSHNKDGCEDCISCVDFVTQNLGEHRCEHCGMDKRIRNPSSYCDHLYYPDNCEECKKLVKQNIKK